MSANDNSFEASVPNLIKLIFKNKFTLGLIVLISLIISYFTYSSLEKVYNGKIIFSTFEEPGHHLLKIINENYLGDISNSLSDRIYRADLISDEDLEEIFLKYNKISSNIDKEEFQNQIKKTNFNFLKKLTFNINEHQIIFYDTDINFIKAYISLVLDKLNSNLINELISVNNQMLAMERQSLEKIIMDNEQINIIMEEFKETLVNIGLDDLDRLFYGSALTFLSNQKNSNEDIKDDTEYQLSIFKHIALQEYLKFQLENNKKLFNYDPNYIEYEQRYPSISLVVVLQSILILSFFFGVVIIIIANILKKEK